MEYDTEEYRVTALVTWVVVTYGNPSDAVALARAIVKDAPACKVIIGCNGAGDASQVYNELGCVSGIEVVDAGHNPGYIGLLRQVWDDIDRRHLVVFSNSDLSIERGFISEIGRAFRDFPKASILAPSILDHGVDQNPYLARMPPRRRRVLMSFLTYLPYALNVLRLINSRRCSSAKSTPSPRSYGEQMFAAHGSCVVFTPLFRDRGGSLEYPVFLFGEELWLASEARRIDTEVRYVPGAVVRHHSHATTGVIRRGAVARAQREAIRFWASRPRYASRL